MSRTIYCPLCGQERQNANTLGGTAHSVFEFNCTRCGKYWCDEFRAMIKQQLPFEYLCAIHECREVTGQTPELTYDRTALTATVVGRSSNDDSNITFDRFPKTIHQKLQKLLGVIIRRTKQLGTRVELNRDSDFLLCYTQSDIEQTFLLESLVQKAFITIGGARNCHAVRHTLAGYEAHEQAKLLEPITVFISSTCYDLIDCRREIAEHLRSLGCEVRLSDSSEHFSVSHSADSIQSCLLNVQKSDLVICIIDREYGPLLRGAYGEKSATHVGIEHARAQNIPVFFAIRKQAF